MVGVEENYGQWCSIEQFGLELRALLRDCQVVISAVGSGQRGSQTAGGGHSLIGIRVDVGDVVESGPLDVLFKFDSGCPLERQGVTADVAISDSTQ